MVAGDPTRSVPDVVGELGDVYRVGEDAVAMYLMLLAMPDPLVATSRGGRAGKRPD